MIGADSLLMRRKKKVKCKLSTCSVSFMLRLNLNNGTVSTITKANLFQEFQEQIMPIGPPDWLGNFMKVITD